MIRLGAAMLHSIKYRSLCGCFFEIEEIDVNNRMQQAFDFALAHAHRQQRSFLARGVLSERGGPFGLSEQRLEIIWREHGYCARGFDGGALHIKHEVRAGPEVPRL